ncbi:tyramine--L-glutamate ligase [Methanocaldococcus infernus]
MKILFFEYAMATNCREFLAEGKMMFDKLLYEFLSLGSVVTLINKELSRPYKNIKNLKVVEPTNLFETLRKINNFDYFLVIAPEEDNILYELTKILEPKGVNLGSSSKAIKVAGDKYLTYEALKDTVKVPKTFQPRKYIVKRRDGCGSQFKVYDEKYIIQEFIEGSPYSASFIVGKKGIKFLSLNKQIVDESGFKGAEVNIDHERKEEIIDECEKALKRIDGLNGYVGVDLVIDDNIYIIEINPRITTTVWGLMTEPPLAKLLIDNAEGKEIKIEKVVGKKFKVGEYG